MSERDDVNDALIKANGEWPQLQQDANAAKKAPKLVRSGRAAELRHLADAKGEEIIALEQKLEALPTEEVVNRVQSVTAEEDVVVVKPWWQFW